MQEKKGKGEQGEPPCSSPTALWRGRLGGQATQHLAAKALAACPLLFPRTGAWESLKKALKATHEEGVWDHLAGTTSAPFEAGKEHKIAVKVIDDRGNELMVEKEL